MSHLILHKVRGEPAFDIAEQMEVDGETWWIIPTSGHRAYPITAHDLGPIIDKCGIAVCNVPADWPDHYNVTGEKPKPGFNIMDIVARALPKITRRI